MTINKIKNITILLLVSILVFLILEITHFNKSILKNEPEIYRSDLCILSKISDLEKIKITSKRDPINDINKFQWGTEKYSMPSSPIYWGYIENDKELSHFVVLDDKNQLWFDIDNRFQNSSEIYKNSADGWEPSYSSIWSWNKTWEVFEYFIKPVDFEIKHDDNNTFGPFSLNSMIVLEDPGTLDKTTLINQKKIPFLNTFSVRVTKHKDNKKFKILLENDICLEMLQIAKKTERIHLVPFF